MKNNLNEEEFFDELYLKLYLELYKKNKASIDRLNLSVVLGALCSVSFSIIALNAPSDLVSGASFGLTTASSIITFLVLTKIYNIFKQTKNEAKRCAEQIVKDTAQINAFIGPLASMFGLDINVTGGVILDGENIFEMFNIDNDSTKVIEVDYEVIDDGEIDLALIQERAFALRDYIGEVAYDGYEDDLAAAEGLVMDIVRCEDSSWTLNTICEINELAKKAYAKALNLYGIGR